MDEDGGLSRVRERLADLASEHMQLKNAVVASQMLTGIADAWEWRLAALEALVPSARAATAASASSAGSGTSVEVKAGRKHRRKRQKSPMLAREEGSEDCAALPGLEDFVAPWCAGSADIGLPSDYPAFLYEDY